MPLLLLLNIRFPSILNYFLESLYRSIIGSVSVIAKLNDYYFKETDIEDDFLLKQLHPIFLQNFGSVFLLNLIVISFYLIVKMAYVLL